ncbi:MAG: carboxypeptidase-like regulatory domain-containing protein [Mucilaginibacter sp.]
MNKQIRKYFAWLIAIGILMTSACKKIDNNSTSAPSVDPGTGITESGQTRVQGIIVNSAGDPLPGVQVSVNNDSPVSSDNNGTFSVDHAVFTDGRVFVLCKKDGYFNGSKGAIAHDGGVTTLRITMVVKQDVRSFASSAGADVVSNDGVRIRIPANGIVSATGGSFNGAVKLATRYINPVAGTIADQMPGGDFRAINKQNKNVHLYSYGAIEVELTTASGEALQLKTGTEATLTIPIAAGQQASAPQTIPLWYFDEVKGKWIEDGSAQKQGNQYLGTVRHFTPWNLDMDIPWSIVNGHVTSCDGSAVGGATVRIGQNSAIADDKGYYEMYVPAGQALTGNVTVFSDNSVGSGDVNIAAINANKTKTVDFQTGCGVVTLFGQMVQAGDKAIWGTVGIKTPKGNFVAITDVNGKFSQPVPANAAVLVTGYAHDGEQSAEIAVNTPAAGTKDLGKILVAKDEQKAGRISFTLNGGGFSNKTIEITSPYSPVMPEAYYVASNNETGIAKAVNGYSIIIAFPGKSTGKPEHVTIAVVMTAEKRTLTADTGHGELTLNITKYGAVGDVLEGTFSGKFKQLNPSTGEQYGDVTVSNGVFKVYRGPDQ